VIALALALGLAAALVADGVGPGVWARAAVPNARVDMHNIIMATLFLILIRVLSLPPENGKRERPISRFGSKGYVT
jgi:hypothetical protein